jgi:hypothetical protein
MTAHPLVMRPAGPGDAAVIADVWLRSFDAALPTVRRAHCDDEVRYQLLTRRALDTAPPRPVRRSACCPSR